VIALHRILLGAVCAAVLALIVGAAAADVPEGPRIAFTVDPVEAPPDANSLRSANSVGGDVRVLGSTPGARRSELVPELPIAWSPDGARLVVAGYHGGSIRLYIVDVTSGRYRLVPNSGGGIFPTFSPDGTHLAFTVSRPEFGSEIATNSATDLEGTAIRAVDLGTGRYEMLTPWRDGLAFLSGSYSPVGSTMLTTRARRGQDRSDIVAIDLATGGRSLIVENAAAPAFSPDGSRFAFVRERSVRRHGGENEATADLYVAAADGTGIDRLTRTPGDFEYLPSWDPSGERIAFTTFPGETGEGNELPSWIGQVNADGTCLRALRRGVSSNFSGAAWRPGPGREAGRIAC
jgi:TolB protein